ncbi:hypothetical protein [Amycolatopsis sp. 195334CR]|uniref:hypothetical protein n=1 Tax=Amycolatopsis sp. 195334CR TaxID=2814588 RepID=UPI001A8D4F57|nr:hypothetical protein [Amycolatopsis sp. 195334CR]MBN6041312.1 hypothetical protein [Amycolatopsis sp. 195334CR]
MDWSLSWTPEDDADLLAGWRLWLELSDQVWPDGSWTGTPADAIRRIRELLAVCDELERGTLTPLVQSMFLTTGAAVGLWRDDDRPLDVDRAALLHADLAVVAEHIDRVLTALAAGGGWTDLNTARHR